MARLPRYSVLTILIAGLVLFTSTGVRAGRAASGSSRAIPTHTNVNPVVPTISRHWRDPAPTDGYFVHRAWIPATISPSMADATWVSAQPIARRAPVQPGSASSGRVRSFKLTAMQEIWLDNGYAGLRMDTTPVRIQIRLWYASPTQWRIERSYLTPPAQPALASAFLPSPNVSVRNGHLWWGYDAAHHTAMVRSVASVQDMFPGGPPLWFETGALESPVPDSAARNLRAFLKYAATCDMPKGVPVSTPALAGQDSVAGHAAYVIDFGDKPCGWTSASAPEEMGRRLMWVDQQTFFLLKLVRYSVMSRLVRPQDKFFERMTVTQLRYNVPLAASLFAFTPPPHTRRAPTAPQPVAPATAKPLAAIRRQVPFPVFVPTWVPYGLRYMQATVDGKQHIAIDYEAHGKHLSIGEGPIGCCLDADPRRYGGPTLPNGRAANLLDVGAQYGGLILWWDQEGTYLALSSATLSKGDLLRIAASMSKTAGPTRALTRRGDDREDGR